MRKAVSSCSEKVQKRLDTGCWRKYDRGMETNQTTTQTPLVSCRKCGDDLTYYPEMEPITDSNGRNRVMCVPCIGMLL